MLTQRALPIIVRRLRLQKSVLGPKTLGALRMTWVSGKDARGPEMPVGLAAGQLEDPVLHTYDEEDRDSPDNGGKLLPQFLYRKATAGRTYRDYRVSYFISALLWFWFSYHMYYHPGHIFGHWYMPYLHEFSDEELGIPPDNAPDPVYWGNHLEEYGTYR